MMAYPLVRAVQPSARIVYRSPVVSTPPSRHASSSPTASRSATSPFAPRHLLSTADLSPQELTTLIRNASNHKASIKSGKVPSHLQDALRAKTLAIMMSKRSTRTRVSLESAIATMGGHPMFLGAGDIQLGVNESLYDTSVVVSSMVSGIIARVHEHDEVTNLAKHSSVPVINALSTLYHPLQILADFLTIHEAFPARATSTSLGLEGLKIAWVGDANNVLYDLIIGASKLGCEFAVATPAEYAIPRDIHGVISSAGPGNNGFKLTETTVPEEAIKDADIIVTDTWVSMGWEEEAKTRLKKFEGFQITTDLAKRGGAKEGWRFMHCLPRHPEEVSDEVFYSPASLVFQEAENRLWTAIAAIEGFIVNKGKIL